MHRRQCLLPAVFPGQGVWLAGIQVCRQVGTLLPHRRVAALPREQTVDWRGAQLRLIADYAPRGERGGPGIYMLGTGIVKFSKDVR